MKDFNFRIGFLVLVFCLASQRNYSQPFVYQSGIALPGVSQSSVAWGDYDNDGNIDLIIAGSSPGRITKLFKNEGGGVFTEQMGVILTEISTGSAAWGDYNNDGFLDILLTGRSNAGVIAEIYLNNGNGTFAKRG